MKEQPSLFLNLSNHPSATWGPEQTAQALALASGLLDIPFPDVDPDAPVESLQAMARNVLESVPTFVRVAMVQGESTLCSLLVGEMGKRGIRCVAATTRRMVVEGPDGIKTSHFQFVRFRDYPPLLPAMPNTSRGSEVSSCYLLHERASELQDDAR